MVYFKSKFCFKQNISGGYGMQSNIVYYYCNEEVFNSIIERHKLWLTSIWDLNDWSEVHWTFKKLWTDIQPELLHNASDKQLELINLINNDINKEVYQIYMYYIICFSIYDDLLSQWRGYADDGRGFSVGINIDKITSQKGIPWFNFDYNKSLGYSPVIYNYKEQYKILLNVFKDIIEMDYRQAPLIVALMNLSRFATIFKNPYYFEENEVRLMYAANISDYKVTNLDENGFITGLFEHTNSICKTTHVEIDLFKGNANSCIEKVVLGPKNKHSSKAIYNKIISNGFSISSDNVVMSQGTYR